MSLSSEDIVSCKVVAYIKGGKQLINTFFLARIGYQALFSA